MHIMLTGFNPFDCAREGLSWRVFSARSGLPTASEQSWQNSVRAEEHIKTRIVDGFVLDEERWRDLPKAKAFVSKFLVADPLERATVDSALKNSWIADDLRGLEHAYGLRIIERS